MTTRRSDVDVLDTIALPRGNCVRFRASHEAIDLDLVAPCHSLLVIRSGAMDVGDSSSWPVLQTGSALFLPAGRACRARAAADTEWYRFDIVDRPTSELMADTTGRAWALNLLREIECREPGWGLLVQGLVLEGLGWLVRRHALTTARPEWLDDAVALARRQQPLAELAATIHRHPSHVAREFRRHEGVSVGEFARRCRLELAAVELERGDRPIGDVALTAGFCDQSHFTNAFRRVFGLTPRAYRNARVARRSESS